MRLSGSASKPGWMPPPSCSKPRGSLSHARRGVAGASAEQLFVSIHRPSMHSLGDPAHELLAARTESVGVSIALLPVAVIGGGPIGLAAAAHLLAQGLEPIGPGGRPLGGDRRADLGPCPDVQPLALQYRPHVPSASPAPRLDGTGPRDVSGRPRTGGSVSRAAGQPARAIIATGYRSTSNRRRPGRDWQSTKRREESRAVRGALHDAGGFRSLSPRAGCHRRLGNLRNAWLGRRQRTARHRGTGRGRSDPLRHARYPWGRPRTLCRSADHGAGFG